MKNLYVIYASVFLSLWTKMLFFFWLTEMGLWCLYVCLLVCATERREKNENSFSWNIYLMDSFVFSIPHYPPSFSQFHQHLTSSFCTDIIASKILKANLWLDKSCPKHFRTKNPHVKCWWDWHLVSRCNGIGSTLRFLMQRWTKIIHILYKFLVKNILHNFEGITHKYLLGYVFNKSSAIFYIQEVFMTKIFFIYVIQLSEELALEITELI